MEHKKSYFSQNMKSKYFSRLLREGMISRIYSLSILFVFLVSCGNQPAALPTEMHVLTLASPMLLPTPTYIPITPSPLPTQPIILVVTPDPIQVERWKEYETALAKAIFPSSFISGEFLCEWEILGRSDQEVEVYVWAVCMSIPPIGTTTQGKETFSSSSTPAVIHLGLDGVIQRVEIPGPGINDYQRMFPTSIQEKFEYYRFGRAGELSEHLERRREHPSEPPLIVLSVTSIP